ncbi:unnamed protein product [Symbiodinium natans]|uniref:Uncharacterized protein n=1 Tax=Symbiodinium natans TaxID=878477 RepID=A0A812PFB9_9DINO|nr:unnamed protein product [Symbiodinium natans]
MASESLAAGPSKPHAEARCADQLESGDVPSDLQTWQLSAARVPRAQLKEALEAAETPRWQLLGGERALDAELRRWQPSSDQEPRLEGLWRPDGELSMPCGGEASFFGADEAVQEVLLLRHELQTARGEVRRLWAQLAARDGRVARLEAELARVAQCPLCGSQTELAA